MPKKPNRPIWNPRRQRPQQPDAPLDALDTFYPPHPNSDRLDRMGSAMNINRPRVSFKPHAKTIRKPRIPAAYVKQALDDDVAMTNGGGREVRFREGLDRESPSFWRGRFSPLPQNQRGGKRGFHSQQYNRKMPQRTSSDPSWFRVSIPNGNKFSKEFIITSLQDFMGNDAFIPIAYNILSTESEFYIDNAEHADKIQSCNKKITTPDNRKLFIRTRPGYPQCNVDNALKEKLKQALGKRYVNETNALDLSRFHNDPDLAPNYFCALFRPAMMMAVIDIVAEHIPNLQALNLNSNRLTSLDKLQMLKTNFKMLKILYIGDNKLRDMHQLDYIKDVQLEELRLDGNPMYLKSMNSRADYISDVRKRFPKLLRLDGEELAKPISFDVENEATKIPPALALFAPSAEAKTVASQFLAEYFRIYDSGNRQDLYNAYHIEARFSLTTAYLANGASYVTESRNLCRINESHKRRKLLKTNRISILAFISELPRTQHYENTFTMDISLATDRMMLITVTGIFKEVESKEGLLRFFNRTFIIVPEGSGYCICNEQMHICQPTDAQEKEIKAQPVNPPQVCSPQSAAGPSMASPPQSVAGPSMASPPPVSHSQENMQRMMALALAQLTNMNLDWSARCLEECSWNYDNALSVFQDCLKRGQIPPDAFKK